MKLLIISLGVYVLLTVTQTQEAKRNKWEEYGNSLEDMDEGSGEGSTGNTLEVLEEPELAGDTDHKANLTEFPAVHFTSSAPVTHVNKDQNGNKDQNMNKGTTDDEDLVFSSGSGEEPVENPIDPKIDEKLINISKDNSSTDEQGVHINSKPTVHDSIWAQPVLLAAIIGGAVVALLCLILVTVFVVYRLRKKDEGSYPLDDHKYYNYTYSKTSDKEFLV